MQQRTVDVEGYVALHSNRYSVPVAWVGRSVEVRETKDKIEIQLDARNIVTHERIPEQQYQRITLAATARHVAKASSAPMHIRKNKPSSKLRRRSPITSPP